MITDNKIVMLSTIDNPFDPFTQFDQWYQYDTRKGYNTCAYLARVTNLSDELTEAEHNEEINSAIAQALELNVTGKYIKVIEGSFIKRPINLKA